MTYRRLVALFFISNGLGGIGLKALGTIRSEGAIPTALVFLYCAAMLSAALDLRRRPGRLEVKNAVIGLVAGVTSALTLAGLGLAVTLVPAHIVFPISSGSTLVLVALVGRVVFKEKIGPYGIAGIVVGGLALILLSV